MTTLQEQTQELSKKSAEKIPQEAQKKMTRFAEQLEEQQVDQEALGVGEQAPNFTIATVSGDEVHLTELLEGGPVILNFYRGGWCPYCNLELQTWEQHHAQVQQLGASLLAISPQVPKQVAADEQRHELSFTLGVDEDFSTSNAYGLGFELTPEIAALYEEMGLGLSKYHTKEDQLILPATYVIDKQGVIRYAHVSIDYTTRAEPQEVLEAVRALTD